MPPSNNPELDDTQFTYGSKSNNYFETNFVSNDFVQVYVDDSIFGSTNKTWCDDFEVLMKGEFEMSAMGELTFFLGLQVKQKPEGIFISQDISMIGSLMYFVKSGNLDSTR
ncbi:retrovirus-related pol polyprotein from transposon TNT 1-94, partial [Tanacetum coccineum]